VPEGTILYLPLTHVAPNDPRFVLITPLLLPLLLLLPQGA
jgi:hypothetical protein